MRYKGRDDMCVSLKKNSWSTSYRVFTHENMYIYDACFVATLINMHVFLSSRG